MIELLSNLGSSFPWIYRAWFLLLSEQYRQTMKLRWQTMKKGYAFLDKLMTIIFILVEIALLVYFILTKGS